MPWNAHKNPAGTIRAPAIAAALRLKQQQQKRTQVEDTITWKRSLHVVEVGDLPLSRKDLATLRHCALLHPDDFPTEAAATGADGAAFVYPRSHAQFVLAVCAHEAVPVGSIALSQPQAINLELCKFQTEMWTLFTERVPVIKVVAIEICPMEEETDEEEDSPTAARIVTDAKEFATAFVTYT